MRTILSLFSFQGRARRASYGIFFAISVVAYVAMNVPLFFWSAQKDPRALLASMKEAEKTNPAAGHIFDWIFKIPHEYVLAGLVAAGVLFALLYIVWIALTVRRLHDMNTTGWLVLIAVVVAFVPILGYLLVVLVLSLWPGTKGANRFGQDPRRPDAVPEVFGREGAPNPSI